MVKAIIFDMDGTLADSHKLQWKAYDYAFSKYGHSITEEDWAEWVTHNWGPDDWIIKYNLKLNGRKIREEKKKIYDLLIAEQMELMPHAKEAVCEMTKHFPLAITSGSRIESIEAIMKKFDLHNNFNHLVSCADVPRAKPHPDVYLKAAELLEIEPLKCLAIEDSVSGYKAAKSAGMKVIVVPDKFTNPSLDNFKEADAIIKDLSELTLDLLNNLSN